MSFASLDDINQWLDEFLWPDLDDRQRLKRERILRAATTLFVRFGYRKTSIDEVAREAGIAKGTLYLYYRNKAELVFHAIALEKQAYLSRLAPVLDSEALPEQRLRSLVTIALTVSLEMPLIARITRGDREIELAIRDIDTSVLVRINDLQTEFMVRLLDEAVAGGWPRSLLVTRAQVLIDLIFSAATSAHLLNDSLPAQDYARVVADIMVNGVLKPSNGEQGDALTGADESAEHSLKEAFST